MKALIIGGGIGGLAAALALRGAGAEVAVYEQARELQPVGAGLAVWPNAMAALERLGVAAAVRALGVPRATGAVRDWRGRVLLYEPPTVASITGGSLVAVHRADLQQALLDALGQDVLYLGRRCLRWEQDEARVWATFADGGVAEGDILVGADGLHSVVRSQLVGPSVPWYAGYTAWRGVVPFDHRQVLVGETWGCGARFGLLPLSRGRVYWFAAANAPQGAPDGPQGRRQELLARFAGWHAPIADVIAATPDAAILRNDIYDRPPLKTWGQGRVTLVGDAAHPMTPDLGQGACQALEDAAVLGARMADNSGDAIGVLRACEAARIPRTRRIVVRSRQLGQIGQWQNPLACRARNLAARLMPASLQARQLAWILDYRPG
jgi:FAD-dependent urate hydroxylase